MTYIWHLLVFVEIYALVAMSLNLLVGFTGLLQVAQAAYFGVGAYAVALISANLSWGFLPSLITAAIVSGVLSLLVSVPAWRFRGDYFVMVSLAVQVALSSAMVNWVELTNGPYGLTGIPVPAIWGSTFATPGSVMVLYGVILLVLGGILVLLQVSPFGRALRAVRDDELAARSLGLPVRQLKLQAFLIASSLAGVAGGMYASYVTYIDPTSFGVNESILLLSMVIVGGTGNVKGPLVGALVLIGLPELLRLLALPSAVADNLRVLAYGLLLIGMMHWRPQGLAGRYNFE